MRIPRRGDSPSVPPRSGAPSRAEVVSRVQQNQAGSSRATRLFLLFLAGLLLIYTVFIVYTALSPPAISGNASIYGSLTVFVALAFVAGYALTLAQAPRSAWLEANELVVQPRLGQPRRAPLGPDLRFVVLRRNAAGLLGPRPTEYVMVVAVGQGTKTYLVGEHFFEFARATE